MTEYLAQQNLDRVVLFGVALTLLYKLNFSFLRVGGRFVTSILGGSVCKGMRVLQNRGGLKAFLGCFPECLVNIIV